MMIISRTHMNELVSLLLFELSYQVNAKFICLDEPIVMS